MATNAKDIYADTVRQLPPNERLRLAALILEDLASSVAFADQWSDQDMQDLAAFSLSHASTYQKDDETR
jgi:hypothetical protein